VDLGSIISRVEKDVFVKKIPSRWVLLHLFGSGVKPSREKAAMKKLKYNIIGVYCSV